MRVITYKIYTIEEHPYPEKVFEWIRENWHDLPDYCIQELVGSLRALEKVAGGLLTYQISAFPDRGDHISYIEYDKDIINSLDTRSYPLTGHIYDQNVITNVKENRTKDLLEMIYKQTDYMYSSKALYEHCEVNEYEFYEMGSFYYEEKK